MSAGNRTPTECFTPCEIPIEDIASMFGVPASVMRELADCTKTSTELASMEATSYVQAIAPALENLLKQAAALEKHVQAPNTD